MADQGTEAPPSPPSPGADGLSTYQLVEAANARLEAAMVAQSKLSPADVLLGVMFVVLLMCAGVLGLIYLRMVTPERVARTTVIGVWEGYEQVTTTTDRTSTMPLDPSKYVCVFDGEGRGQLFWFLNSADAQQVAWFDWLILEDGADELSYALATDRHGYMLFTAQVVDGEYLGKITLLPQFEGDVEIVMLFRKVSFSATVETKGDSPFKGSGFAKGRPVHDG